MLRARKGVYMIYSLAVQRLTARLYEAQVSYVIDMAQKLDINAREKAEARGTRVEFVHEKTGTLEAHTIPHYFVPIELWQAFPDTLLMRLDGYDIAMIGMTPYQRVIISH